MWCAAGGGKGREVEAVVWVRQVWGRAGRLAQAHAMTLNSVLYLRVQAYSPRTSICLGAGAALR